MCAASLAPLDSPPVGGATRTRAFAGADAHSATPSVRLRSEAKEAVFVSARRISIFDTTLRDGEQSPGIALQPHEKAEIAEQLERLGVDVVEAGFPGASPGDFEGVREVALALGTPTVAALARTRVEDIDAAGEALAGARRSRIHVFIATSPVHMERKLGLEPAEVVRQARSAVEHARTLADEVEFSCEDATRSDPAFVARVCRVAVEAGATTSTSRPRSTRRRLRRRRGSSRS